MYNIPYFKANDDAEVLAFMKAHPFIILCVVHEIWQVLDYFFRKQPYDLAYA